MHPSNTAFALAAFVILGCSDPGVRPMQPNKPQSPALAQAYRIDPVESACAGAVESACAGAVESACAGAVESACAGPIAEAHEKTTDLGDVVDYLNGTLPRDSGWVVTEVRSIDARGRITGVGTFHGERHAFMLTPR